MLERQAQSEEKRKEMAQSRRAVSGQPKKDIFHS